MSRDFFNHKTILVTGAAGFIGSHLCDKLLSLGASVVGVDNFITGRRENISHLLEEKSLNFTFIEADVSNNPSDYLNKEIKLDAILHFASPASPPRYQAHPVETYLVNSLATHQLLQHLLKTNQKARFLFASTSEVYGDPLEHPQKESYWGNVNPNGVRSCYDESKRIGETICGVHQRDLGLDVRIVRIFNTYGPRIDPKDGRVIPNFIKQTLDKSPLTIHGEGNQTRSYCYIDDLVEGILSFLSIDDLSGETINLGNPTEKTVLELAKIIQNLTQTTGEELTFKPLPKDDPTRRKPNISKAKNLLGWEPKTSLNEGLLKTIEYFQKHSSNA